MWIGFLSSDISTSAISSVLSSFFSEKANKKVVTIIYEIMNAKSSRKGKKYMVICRCPRGVVDLKKGKVKGMVLHRKRVNVENDKVKDVWFTINGLNLIKEKEGKTGRDVIDWWKYAGCLIYSNQKSLRIDRLRFVALYRKSFNNMEEGNG